MNPLNTENAPVLISSYNRPQKLDTCLGSLVRCKNYASRQVHVTVDAPADDSHVSLVAECRKIAMSYAQRYKNIILHLPEVNTGGKIIQETVDKIFESSPTLIALEDDNILHHGFLDYMDYHLFVNKNNRTVFAVCGYSFPINSDTNGVADVFYWQNHNAWGTGYYRDRWREFKLQTKDSSYFLEQYLVNFNLVLHRQNIAGHFIRNALATYLRAKDHKDILVSIYLSQKTLHNIYPKYSFVLNTGHDGSGTNNTSITEKYLINEFKCDRIDPRSAPVHCVKARRLLRLFFKRPIKQQLVDYAIYFVVYIFLVIKLRLIKRS